MQKKCTSLCTRQILEVGEVVFENSLQGLSTIQVSFGTHTNI